MSSGVQVADDVVVAFNEMKLKHNARYLIFKIENKKEIVIDKKGEKTDSFADAQTMLKESKEPRYSVIDFEYETSDGCKKERLVFCFWCPDNGPVMQKMLYASSKDAIKKKLLGIYAEIQANDVSDLEEKEFVAKCEKHRSG